MKFHGRRTFHPHRAARVALLFSLFFVLMSFEVVTDPRTYLKPATREQAGEQIDIWLIMSAKKNPAAPELASARSRVISWMSSEGRFVVHRIFLSGLIAAYLAAAVMLWKKHPLAYRAALAALALKLGHIGFFFWSAYAGRACVSDAFGFPRAPAIVLGPNEIHYGLGALLALICLSYFFWLETHRRPA